MKSKNVITKINLKRTIQIKGKYKHTFIQSNNQANKQTTNKQTNNEQTNKQINTNKMKQTKKYIEETQ
jgi:hypothetical protein